MVDAAGAALPRLLVFSEVIPESRNAGSIQLLRLLADYPADRLLVLGPKPHPDSQLLPSRYETLQNAVLGRLYRSRLWRLKRSLDMFGIFSEVSVREAERLIASFQPDVVLSVMQESQFYCAAWRYCLRKSIPLVIIVHDLVEEAEPVYWWALGRQRRRNAAVYRDSTARLCVSPAMVERLRNDYGEVGSVLYPIRSEELMPRPLSANARLRTEGRLTVGYAGSLVYGYREGIRAILPALKAANAVLRVYSANSPDFLWDNVEYAGFAASPLQMWARVKEECDAVLLPYTWQPGFRKLYETHFPSKLPEYLGLCMPAIIRGPAYAAGVVWGRKHPDAVLTIDDPSDDAMRNALVSLCNDAGLRTKLAAESVRVGNDEFNPAMIRSQFIQQLRQAVPRAAALSVGTVPEAAQ